MPLIPGGNTNAPTIMVAERGRRPLIRAASQPFGAWPQCPHEHAQASPGRARDGERWRCSQQTHREGAGEPLVLIHGIGLRWQIWRPVIGPLAEDFEVIACDSPGFGQSPALVAGVSPTIPPTRMRSSASSPPRSSARPHVAGNSMGGAIALELARRGAVRIGHGDLSCRLLTAAERRFCQASLVSLAQTPRAARPALEALIRTRAGRTALLWQTFAGPPACRQRRP